MVITISSFSLKIKISCGEKAQTRLQPNVLLESPGLESAQIYEVNYQLTFYLYHRKEQSSGSS